jgi:phytol kinase
MSMHNNVSARYVGFGREKVIALVQEFPGELLRKSLHLLIALVPPLASINKPLTLALLATGTLVYTFAEAARLSGRPIYLISDITVLASRDRETGRFVLGPVTLGLGAMLALFLYPNPASSIAIYALAFGDGLASLAGKMIGGAKVPLFGQKTFAGSLACFLSVFTVTCALTTRPVESLVIASVATMLEIIPFGDFDNLVIPFGVGLVASSLLIG